MKQKWLSLVLALALCAGLCVPASAESRVCTGEYAKVSCGDRFTAAIDNGGTLWMWGSNRYGALGIGMDDDELSYSVEPVKVMDDVLSVSCGIDFTAALKRDGSLWMWGSNYPGTLGNGYVGNGGTKYFVYQTSPIKIMDDVAYVYCAGTSVGAVKKDGSLWTWGNIARGVLGNGNTWNANLGAQGSTSAQTVPVKILDDVKCFRICSSHAAAIKTDGSLWMWGDNSNGQLGKPGVYDLESYVMDIDTPLKLQTVPIKVMDHAANVFCTNAETVVIKDDGSVWCCGAGTYEGPLYDLLRSKGSSGFIKAPLSDIASYSSAGYLKTDGSLWVWSSAIPWSDKYDHTRGAMVKLMDHVDAMSYSASAGMAVRSDHTLWAWGNNEVGQLSIPLDKTDRWNKQTFPVKIMDNIALSGPGSAAPETPSGFTDVPAGAYYADAVKWAVDRKITSGTGDGSTFSPDLTCTRAEILTFLWRAHGSPEPAASNPFTDVKAGDYYYKAALWAAEKGLVPGSVFSGGTDCTRAMTVEYLWKAAGSPAAAQASFTDVPANADYAQAVAWAVEKGVTTGTGDGSAFSPDLTCTRGQIAAFLHRALG